MLAKNVSKGVLSIGAWTITKVLASALATPVLSRVLGPAGYGQYSYFFSVMFLAAPLANAGTMQTLWKYVAERADPERRARVAAFCKALNLLAASGVAVGVGVLVWQDSPVEPAWLFTFVIVGSVLLEQVWWYARGILNGLQREELTGIPGSFGAIITSVMSVIMALSGGGLTGVLSGILLGNAFMGVITLRSAHRLVPAGPLREGLGSQDPAASTLARFAVSTMLFSSLSMVLYKGSVVLVRHVTGDDAQTGLFATALQMAEFVWVIVIAVEGVMMQTTARLWAEGRTEEISSVVSRLVRYTGLVTGLLLTVVFVFAEDVIRVYFGMRFIDAAPTLRTIIPGVFSYSLARLLGPVVHARGRVLALALVIGAAAGVSLGLNALLVPPLGIIGAGIGSSLGYGMAVVPYVLLLRHDGVHPFRDQLFLRQLCLFLCTGLLSWGAGMLASNPFVRLPIGCIVAFLVWLVGALRLDIIRVQEIDDIVSSLPGGIRTFGERAFAPVRPVLQFLAGSRRKGSAQ